MTQATKKYYTPEEYLALEEKATYKNQYYQGEIYQMAGGTPNHNQIASNINVALNTALLDKPCVTYTSDMRIQVKANGFISYADTLVVCGELELMEGRSDTVNNPILIVEVLSKSTRNFDREDKSRLYRDLESFQVYLIVHQAEVYLEYHYKLPDGSWKLEIYQNLAVTIKLEALEIELRLARIYSKVQFLF